MNHARTREIAADLTAPLVKQAFPEDHPFGFCQLPASIMTSKACPAHMALPTCISTCPVLSAFS